MFQCKNLRCVAAISECESASATTVRMEYTLDANDATTINFAFKGIKPVGRLALPPQSIYFSTKKAQKLMFTPLPSDVASKIKNIVSPKTLTYLKEFFAIEDSIDGAFSQVTPQVDIKYAGAEGGEAVLRYGAKIEFLVDYHGWPHGMDQQHDTCLAKVTQGEEDNG